MTHERPLVAWSGRAFASHRDPDQGEGNRTAPTQSSLGTERRHRLESTFVRVHRERGLVLIIAYKLGKALLWFVFALMLVVAMRMGLGHRMVGFAEQLRHHSGAWSLRLAEIVVRASTRRGLWTITFALVADGLLSLIEGWALLRGRWWGPWLVVVATGSLLPFEVAALVTHPHAVRAALLLANTAIVVYLARTAMREHRLRRLAEHAPQSDGSRREASPPG
jgi:uncharacterized membrane protein (DUF2068 family)